MKFPNQNTLYGHNFKALYGLVADDNIEQVV